MSFKQTLKRSDAVAGVVKGAAAARDCSV